MYSTHIVVVFERITIMTAGSTIIRMEDREIRLRLYCNGYTTYITFKPTL